LDSLDNDGDIWDLRDCGFCFDQWSIF